MHLYPFDYKSVFTQTSICNEFVGAGLEDQSPRVPCFSNTSKYLPV